MRWQNNPFQGDQAGPGAVAREGIAALDPVNGLPLSWNPGRARGVGAQALFATSQGLWVGSDTTRIGGEKHGRVALMPLAGGTTIPNVPAAACPNDLFVAQQTAGGVLQRRAVDANGAPTGVAEHRQHVRWTGRRCAVRSCSTARSTTGSATGRSTSAPSTRSPARPAPRSP